MSEPETKKTRVEEGEGAAADAAPLKRAIITGITGQDGSYLAEFLLEKVRSPFSGFSILLFFAAT